MKRFINVIMIISLTILGFSLGDAKGLAKEDDEPPESIEIIEDVIFNRYEKYIHNFIPGDSNNQLRLRELEVIDQNRKEAEQRLRKTIVYSSKGNTYIPGYCTWYVKNEKPEVPNGYGNAKNWPVNSQIPQVGAVVVTWESWLGHVALTTVVDGDYIEITEMNQQGWWVESTRRLKWKDNGIIKGFLII